LKNDPSKDASGLSVEARHGAETQGDEKTGYARKISTNEEGPSGLASRTRGAGIAETSTLHPSKSLQTRSRGYGIGGGYERPYKREKPRRGDSRRLLYGPIPHAGYYGAGEAMRPFKEGQATFGEEELSWYQKQYGEQTSGFEKTSGFEGGKK
jgi:hypothetical protein